MTEAPNGICTGPDLFRWAADNNIAMRNIKDVKLGDVVVCSQTKNWCSPVTMGKIKALSLDKRIALSNINGKGIFCMMMHFVLNNAHALCFA